MYIAFFLLSSIVQNSLDSFLTEDMSQLLSQHFRLNASPIHKRRWLLSSSSSTAFSPTLILPTTSFDFVGNLHQD